MIRKSLCMAAIALLCGTSAIAQTTGGTGSGSGSGMGGQSGSSSTQQPGGSSGSMGTMPEQQGTMGTTGPMGAEPGQSGSMGGQQGQGSTGGSEMGGQQGQGSMGGSMGGQQDQGSMGGSEMGGQSAMQGQQSENFAAFDENKDGSLDRAEFARAMQVQGAMPAAGGQGGASASGKMPQGDRAISPLNQSSLDFQRADKDSDGKVSQEEFSSFSPEQQQ